MSQITYLRWKPGQPREGRVIPPLTPGHPAASFPCLACREKLANGRPVQLLAIGPDSEESRAKAAAGRWHTALALLLHAECLGTSPAVAAPARPDRPVPKQCDHCNRSLLLVQTAGGPLLIDAEPSERGNVLLLPGEVGVLGPKHADAARAGGKQLHEAHRWTCPHASRWTCPHASRWATDHHI